VSGRPKFFCLYREDWCFLCGSNLCGSFVFFPFVYSSSPPVLFCVAVSCFRLKVMLCLPVRFSCRLKVVRP